MKYFVLLLIILITACVTNQEIQAAREEKCQGYGFKPKTDAFATCMMNLEMDANQRAASVQLPSAVQPDFRSLMPNKRY